MVRVARCRIPAVNGARSLLTERLHRFNEENRPLKPEVKDMTVSMQDFLAERYPKNGRSSKAMQEDDNCTEAVICVGANCWVDSKECGDGPPSDNSGGGVPGDDGSEGGGSGYPPNGGDGGGAPDPCDGTRTSFCDNGPPAEPPYPVSDDLYDQLNEREKELCWNNPSQCYTVWQYADWALKWARQVESAGAHNGLQDAIRHAAWSGRITLIYDSEIAEAWTAAHECNSSHPEETRMDKYNNRVGRQIGSSASSLSDLKSKIRRASENNRLCNNLSDC